MHESNRTVHGLWIGSALSKLELLTLYSYVHHGHSFQLWTYSDLCTPLPKDVSVRDANQILPAEYVFRCSIPDAGNGMGAGSCAGFSDLFRYKLLYDFGGYWTDMDVTCLKPLDFPEPYLFRSHRVGAVGNVMKCPPRSALMARTYERAAHNLSIEWDWHFGNRALSYTVRELGLSQYIRADIGNEDLWNGHVRGFLLEDTPIPQQFYIIHWLNECWRTLRANDGFFKGKRMMNDIPEKDFAKPGTTLARLYQQYGL